MKEINGRKFFFKDDHSLMTGFVTYNGSTYYVASNFFTATGFTKIDGKTYYFGTDGKMLTSTGIVAVGNASYYFNSDHYLESGLKTVGGKTYYFNPSSYKMSTGLVTISGKQYLFSVDGAMFTGQGLVETSDYYYVRTNNGDINAYKKTTAMQRVYNDCVAVYNSVGKNLYNCYLWVVNNVSYVTQGDNTTSDYTDSMYFSLPGFESGQGDCRTYAGTIYWMGIFLGYEMHYVNGYVAVTNGQNEHSWVEYIDNNGTTYVIDPCFPVEMGGANGYMITYGASGTWVYQNYEWGT